MALIGAKALGFTLAESGAIGIIGGADGPMAIFVTMKLAPHLLPQISVAAYSYMALMPLIQPPIMKLPTTKKERAIVMETPRTVSRLETIVLTIAIGSTMNAEPFKTIKIVGLGTGSGVLMAKLMNVISGGRSIPSSDRRG